MYQSVMVFCFYLRGPYFNTVPTSSDLCFVYSLLPYLPAMYANPILIHRRFRWALATRSAICIQKVARGRAGRRRARRAREAVRRNAAARKIQDQVRGAGGHKPPGNRRRSGSEKNGIGYYWGFAQEEEQGARGTACRVRAI